MPVANDVEQLLEDAELRRQGGEAAAGEGRAVLVGQHQGADVGQREAAVAVVVEQAGGGLAAQPLAHPALVQSGLGGQRLAGQRPGAVERLYRPRWWPR